MTGEDNKAFFLFPAIQYSPSCSCPHRERDIGKETEARDRRQTIMGYRQRGYRGGQMEGKNREGEIEVKRHREKETKGKKQRDCEEKTQR